MLLNMTNHHRYMFLMRELRLGKTLSEADMKWIGEYQYALYEFEKESGNE